VARGYITLAQNSGSVDYIKQAYALALSIKLTQKGVNNFAVCVESRDCVPTQYRHVFDYIIEIPNDEAKDSTWKINNKWKYYEMSPFDETVILDADMVFTTDISHWWDFLSEHNIYYTNKVLNFKGRYAKDNAYRSLFRNNNLPNVYTAFFYFKKTKNAKAFFETCKNIYHNWEDYKREFAPIGEAPVSGDAVFAISAKIHDIRLDSEYPTFVHMKSKLQEVPMQFITEEWNKHIPTYIDNDSNIKIGNYLQTAPIHYHIKSWLTEEHIQLMEKLYNGRKEINNI